VIQFSGVPLCAGALLIGVGVWSQRAFGGLQTQLATNQSQAKILVSRLETQQRSVDSLAEGLEVAIFICDQKSQILYANDRATRLFNFQDPRGRQLLAVTLSHELERIAMEAIRTLQPQSGEVSFALPGERVGLVRAWVNPDDPGRVFLSIYDITDLRRLERVRQDFVANVSHELRTPMTLIRSMSETLLDDAPEGTQSERYLGKIIEEVDRLSMICQDLLILSAAESNPVRKHSCDIASVVRSTVEQLTGRATQKGLKLEISGAEKCLIEANTAQMIQVSLNLIENAINYTNQGHVLVDLECRTDGAKIVIEDSGIGISSEHLPRVFERFYRVDKGRSRVTGGTGLGLSIVKHIVEAHGGTVTVESVLQRGSKFTVFLPKGEQDSVPG
jgi:two-component system phosphate regulon sensor histidine kinase PhoR